MAPRRASRAAAQSTTDILGEPQIVEAALRLIRKDGIDKLSMRTLAAQLGVTPMAIYYHVPNKEALLDRVVDEVYGQIPTPPPDPARWQEQLKAYVLSAKQLVDAYPGLSRVIVKRPNSKAGRTLTRYAISLLLAAGFDTREAALALATYQTYLFGVYSAQRAFAARLRERSDRPKREKVAAEGDRIEAVARHLRELRPEDLLHYGIDAVIEGIAAHAKSTRVRRLASAQR